MLGDSEHLSGRIPDVTSQIRAVFFDLYDTLIGFDPPREVVQSRAMNPFGYVVDKEGIDAGYKMADARSRRKRSQTSFRVMNS
jgi:FMN phosphatase YigB (HAD superfamily)